MCFVKNSWCSLKKADFNVVLDGGRNGLEPNKAVCSDGLWFDSLLSLSTPFTIPPHPLSSKQTLSQRNGCPSTIKKAMDVWKLLLQFTLQGGRNRKSLLSLTLDMATWLTLFFISPPQQPIHPTSRKDYSF